MRHRNVTRCLFVLLSVFLAGCAADTDTALVGSHRAFLAQQKGDWEQAIEIRKDVIKRFPNYPFMADLHFEQAMAYVYLSQDEKAIESFTAAIELDPEFREAVARRSEANFRAGHYKQAIEDSNRVIALDTDANFNMGQLYLTRADAYFKTGDAPRALHNWELATLVAPRLKTPHLRIASYYSDIGQTELALKSIDRAIELDGEDPAIQYRRSILLAMLDRQEEAQTALDKARKLDQQGELNLPDTIDEVMAEIEKEKQAHQEQIAAKPIPTADLIDKMESDQAIKIAKKFLKGQGLETLEKPAQLANAVVCKEDQQEFQVLVKIARGEDEDQNFVLTREEYNLAVQQSSSLGMVVVSGINFDPRTGDIAPNSGRVIAYAQKWKPDPSRFKPAAYEYRVSRKKP